jgi:DNA topoisomerase-2
MSQTSDTSSISSSKSSSSGDDGSQYTHVSHEEHVTLAPDTYVGSVEGETTNRYVLVTESDSEGNANHRIVEKSVKIVPALFKIYDEVLTNAVDHWKRLLTHQEQGKDIKHLVTEIKVWINKEDGEITVQNNGEGIDIVWLEEHQMYPAELIFGKLLTGTNYNLEEEKTWGGKNGYGAKLANIFSTFFRVETVDAKRQLRLSQEYTNNMKDRTPPQIKKSKVKPFTKITFRPDFKRFGLEGLDSDTISLFQKRVYDMAAWTDRKVSVYLDGTKLTVNTFEKYVDLYLGPKDARPRVYCKPNDRWEVIATYSDDDAFQQVSFVNGISTSRGGRHVDYMCDQIKDGIVQLVKKKKKMDVKPATVKNQLMLFVKALITNPAFDSQTKETLTTNKKKFGSTGILDDKFLEKLYKTPIVERILAETAFKSNKTGKKTDGKKQRKLTGIPKLCDANKAGTNKSKECTLILTEGDSAKTTAVSGLSVVGRDFWGVFPLRGKLLNVKDVAMERVFKNEEINNLKKILGLKNGETYDGKKDSEWPLRYGRILIMTDQDHDGSHIKGLVMNLFHTHWHSLIEQNFITSMVTPIVKATKGKSVISFYTLSDYQLWKEAESNIKSWTVKYYKGLGTSNTQEAKGYFRNLHVLNYTYDKETSDKAIDLAFNKSMASDRKLWLQKYEPDRILDYKQDNISYSDFVDRELIHFSQADCLRSIPDIRDGLKPSQRKVLYCCFKRKSLLKNELKVAQLAGYVSEQSSYHHGEASLMGSIINLAQDFTGSNNLNLLYPSGQFGSRLHGGKDASSPRYIFTRLSDVTPYIFPEADFGILKYLNDDGFPIEPECYLPIIPMLLVNGTRGIGTGYASNVPCFNPMDLITCIENRIQGKPMILPKPYYQGFTGEIKEEDGSYSSWGKYQITGTYDVRVTELPVASWTQPYKDYLDTCIRDRASDKKNKKQFLKTFDDYCTESKVDFRLKFHEPVKSFTEKKLLELLKMKSSSETSIRNMVVYDSSNTIRKFNNVLDIIEDYFDARLQGYVDRREMLIKQLQDECNILEDKVKFINGVLSQDVDLRNKPEAQVDTELEEFGLRRLKGEPPSFDYLTSMPMRSLTKERVEELQKKYADKQQELAVLENKTPSMLWTDELSNLKIFLRKQEEAKQKEALKESLLPTKSKGKAKASSRTKKK